MLTTAQLVYRVKEGWRRLRKKVSTAEPVHSGAGRHYHSICYKDSLYIHTFYFVIEHRVD